MEEQLRPFGCIVDIDDPRYVKATLRSVIIPEHIKLMVKGYS
jgi:hypothetical protein